MDVAVHFVKAHGKTGEKVFKVTRVRLAPRERIELRNTFSLPCTLRGCRGLAGTRSRSS